MEGGNRWFVHNGETNIACPWRADFARLSQEKYRALLYHGQQESKEHKRLKNFIADYLEKNPDTKVPVWRDKVRIGEFLKGEWKRPDVRALIGDKELVFEVQLSYTFLSEVIRRDNFYQQETHIIWVFRRFEWRREAISDEAFYNHRNLFILDEDAELQTIETGKFTMKCYYQQPIIKSKNLQEIWRFKYVTLDDLKFPEPGYRPYYIDFNDFRIEAHRRAFLGELIRHLRKYFKNKKIIISQELQTKWRELISVSGLILPTGFSQFIFFNEIMPRMLSMMYGKPIGYKTVWNAIHAAFAGRVSGKSAQTQTIDKPDQKIGKYSFDMLYLIGLHIFCPKLKDEHSQWVAAHRDTVISSITEHKLKSPYARTTSYDSALGLCLPKLAKSLANPFGVRQE